MTYMYAFAGLPIRSPEGSQLSNVWLEAPDILGIQLADDPIRLGNIYDTGTRQAQAYNRVFRMANPRDGGAVESCVVIGAEKRFVKFMDLPPLKWIDRLAVRDKSKYTITGGSGLTVNAIYYQQEAQDQGALGLRSPMFVSMTVRLYLHLASAPLEGTAYTIEHADGAFEPITFTYSDRTMRAGGLRVSAGGHKPNDPIKYAYLASHIPQAPNNGVIDYAGTYGMANWSLLDSGGNIVKTGALTQRVAWNETEAHDFYSSGIDLADLSQSWTVTDVQKGNPTVVTFAGGHGFAAGDRVRFRGMSGMTQLEGTGTTHAWIAPVVSAADATTITIPVNSTNYRRLTTGTYDTSLGGVENQAYKCYNTNRAGTTVWGIDYSDVTAPGTYYLYIPGYGVSDPIVIATDAWAKNAAFHHKGIYNLRLGCALTKTGYSRGSALVDGENGTQNYWSNLPALWASEFSTASYGNKVPSGMASLTTSLAYNRNTWLPWLTNNRAVGSRPGHQDASDNDDILIDHARGWSELAWVFEALAPASRFLPFDVQLSSEVLDPKLFAGTDALPPLFHEIFWYAEAFRTMQNTDSGNSVLFGSIPGGYGIGHFSQQTPESGEPINYYRGTDPQGGVPQTGAFTLGAFLYAPDHLSGLYAVQLFAKCAIIAYGYGLGTLGDTYKGAAVNLLNWCEGIASDTVTRDAYYKTHLGLFDKMSTQASGPGFKTWTQTTYDKNMAAVLTAYNYFRPGVFATMWRLSGINASGVYPAAGAPTPDWTHYGSVADANYGRNSMVGTQGGWDYWQCGTHPNYNATHAAYMQHHWYTSINPALSINSGLAFMTNGYAARGGIAPDYRFMLKHMLEAFLGNSPATSDWLKGLLAHYAFEYGANLMGRGLAVGMGPRPTVNIDHLDSYKSAQPSPIGITPYSFNQSGYGSYYINALFNFAKGPNADGNLDFIAGNITGTNEANYGSKKMWEPWNYGQAQWQFFPQNQYLIRICEYDLLTELNYLAIALWLHGWDGAAI